VVVVMISISTAFFLWFIGISNYGAANKLHRVHASVSDSCHMENEIRASWDSLQPKCLVKSVTQPCKKFHQNNKTSCDILTLKMQSFSLESLLRAVIDSENNIHVRKMVIKWEQPHPMNGSIGTIIDDFLIPRPWWQVTKEPFSWQNESANEIVLTRCSTSWEPYFRYLSIIHFPNSGTCSNTSLLVGRSSCVHPGWFSVLSFYRVSSSSHPYSIHTTYFPFLTDRKTHSNAWISDSDCPSSITNRWNCAFLPTTNCTLPSHITNCDNNTCLHEQNEGFSLHLDKADISGKKIDKTELGKYGKVPLPGSNISQGSTSLASPYVALPYNRSYVLAHYKKRDVLNTIDLTTVVYMHRFLLRQSAFYRSKIAEIIHKFRESSSPHLDATASCVAVQLRRGDRAIPAHLDPEEYCYNATHKLPCDGGYCNPDLGCNENGGVPFAAINLSHVVEKVPMLVGPLVKNLLVFSDDPHWLQLQIAAMKKISPSWNIYTLPAPKPKEEEPKHTHEPSAGYHYMRSEGGTESGTFLFASIELASQCDAFIGHLGSGSTMMYHHYMCMNHAGMSGVCPPTYDMRHGLWLN